MPDLLRDELQAALADRYAIERELGRGGMATVYLARDVKHARPVALKLLNPDLGAVLGAERFLSEIRVTANLQHPNLLPLFDSGEANGLLYYVMPYVEGESLRARLDREKQLPMDEAVRISVAIANALEYAHSHGIIHRDLKPENILLQHDQPIVADFGIALAVSNAGGARVTQTGLSLGTPQYMSPEQATGDRTIDKRSDIYSLGAMTYEMLTGEPPHTGATSQAIIARLMTEDPRAISTSRRNVSPYVEGAVHRALEKLPADRFATAREFADAMQGRIATVATVRASRSSRSSLAAGVSSLIFAALAIAATVGWYRATHRPPPPVLRFSLEQPGEHVDNVASGYSIAISPDGQSIAYRAGMPQHVMIRRLDQLNAVSYPKLTGTDLHFSEDGKAIAYMSSGIRWAPAGPNDASADPTLVATLSTWTGLAWESGRDIVWLSGDTLWRVAPTGGKRTMVASIDTTIGQWSNAALLPNGTVAVRVTPRGSGFGTTGDRLGLIRESDGKYVVVDVPFESLVGYADGVLIIGQVGGRVVAVDADIDTGKLRGDPVTVVENVSSKSQGGVAAVMSREGTLAYMLGSTQSTQQIVDDKGAVVDAIPEMRNFVSPSWSPDGARLAFGIAVDAGYEVWMYDLRSRLLSRVAPDGYRTTWTPDGKRIAFTEGGTRPRAMWVPADGSSAPEQIPGTEGLLARQLSFSSDGKYLAVYVTSGGQASAYTVSLADRTRQPLLPDVRFPAEPAISPNRKWVSYTSTEAGQPEIVVRPFPTGTGRLQISAKGGWEAKWSRDGTRLFYRDASAVRAATLDVSGAMPRVVRVDSLFPDVWVSNTSGFSWDVHPSGKRFVMRRESGDARIIVEKNWLPAIKEKLKGR